MPQENTILNLVFSKTADNKYSGKINSLHILLFLFMLVSLKIIELSNIKYPSCIFFKNEHYFLKILSNIHIAHSSACCAYSLSKHDAEPHSNSLCPQSSYHFTKQPKTEQDEMGEEKKRPQS